MALMNTTKGSGPGIRGVGGGGCTLPMDPSMKGSGHRTSVMAKDCCSCVSLSFTAGSCGVWASERFASLL